MTQLNSNYVTSQRTNSMRLVLVMIGIFVCGCVVGGTVTRAVSRHQWRMAMRNPESLASRISPQIVDTVGLRDEQLVRIEYLINKRYDRMEAVRAEIYPLQLAEFDQLCTEIDKELDGSQRTKWAAMISKLKDEYLPLPPVAPPTADFIFMNFDANDDEVLESSELPPPMWMRVRNADLDGDSQVTRAEFEAVRSRLWP